MKQVFITLAAVIVAAALVWLFGINPKYKRLILQGVEQGKQIEQKRLQHYQDSIKYDVVLKQMEAKEQSDRVYENRIEALRDELASNKTKGRERKEQLSDLTEQGVDSIYSSYVKNKTEAVAKFYDLDDCRTENRLLNAEISVMNQNISDNNALIDQLNGFIIETNNNEVALRVENDQLKADLTETKGKLSTRTTQRNITWGAIIIVVTGFIILN